MAKKRITHRSLKPKMIELFRDEDIQIIFGISRTCLFYWRKQGSIPFRKIGGTNYYSKVAIERMFLNNDGRLDC